MYVQIIKEINTRTDYFALFPFRKLFTKRRNKREYVSG